MGNYEWAMRRFWHVVARVFAWEDQSQTRVARGSMCAFDFRSLLQFAPRPNISAVEQQP